MDTADIILAQFDRCAEALTFPMLDNGYVYLADVRLNVFRSDLDWLIILESLGAHSPRFSRFDCFQNCLHLFGSRLHRGPGTANGDFLFPIENCPDAPLFTNESEWLARKDASCVMVRGRRLALDFAAERLKAKGIELIEPPAKDPPAILRSLLPEHRELLLATPEELAQRNPHGLPLWLRLDQWHHPDLGGGELPSQSETFQMLATAIADGDRTKYRPAQPPNTHWGNWPDGGSRVYPRPSAVKSLPLTRAPVVVSGFSASFTPRKLPRRRERMKSRDAPHRSGLGKCAWMALLLFAFYVLSTGPVGKLVEHGVISEPLAESIYSPLLWLRNNCPPMMKFFDWYLGTLWQVL
jgi:hypothetical protein